jgi:hypothetical protein
VGSAHVPENPERAYRGLIRKPCKGLKKVLSKKKKKNVDEKQMLRVQLPRVCLRSKSLYHLLRERSYDNVLY